MFNVAIVVRNPPYPTSILYLDCFETNVPKLTLNIMMFIIMIIMILFFLTVISQFYIEGPSVHQREASLLNPAACCDPSSDLSDLTSFH